METLQPAAATTVTVETPCIRCGYSLRGLASNSNCPECATPVERSLLGDLLIYSDPRYVRKLRTGATLVMTSILLIVGMVVGSMLLGFTVAMAGGGAFFVFIMIAAGLLMLGSFILYLVGWWILATPDRDQLTENKGERPRTYVRYAVVGTVAMKLLSIAVDVAGSVPTDL